MPIEKHNISDQAIFDVARKMDSRDARDAYLKQMCGADSAREQRVRALLRAYEEDASFLESPAPELGATRDYAVAEQPGTLIGPYTLREQIGEGGFGVVFRAEQSAPVRRRVALKVIKPGMDTRKVIARFEAEEQAMALMDHPHIAKVFDAGVTASGRPYFVMELVQGVPITDYCDRRQLSTRERLELFVSVCQAVQHAHQKGVIEEYRMTCTTLCEVVSRGQDPEAASLAAWTCALAADAVDDYGPIIALAHQAVDVSSENNQYLQALGAILFRAGQIEAAVEKLTDVQLREASNDRTSNTSPAYSLYFLAMVHNRQGNADEARESLEQATEQAEQEIEDDAAWNRRLTLDLLRREATALLLLKDDAPAHSEPEKSVSKSPAVKQEKPDE